MIDPIELKVLRVEEYKSIHTNTTTASNEGFSKDSLPRRSANYEPDLLGKDFYRKDVKPLTVISEGGPAFQLKGYEVSWQKFNLRIGFNVREGLVLYDISYKDGKDVRPLIYRAALSEMIVPYGDAREPFQYRHVSGNSFIWSFILYKLIIVIASHFPNY